MATTTAPGATSAIDLLKSDHEQVKQLFDQYDALSQSGTSEQDKQQLARRICTMLTAHATVEEEILYPAARTTIQEPQLVDEATVEHASAKDLIAQIEGMSPSDPLYDAKLKVLGEYVKHHVKEEENELFPQLKQSGVDLQALGEQLAARKQEFMTQGQRANV
jgi:hemerythrin superfamily protein